MKKGYIMECQICMFEAIDKLDSFIIGFLIVGQGKRGLNRICLMQHAHFVCKHNNNFALWSLTHFGSIKYCFSFIHAILTEEVMENPRLPLQTIIRNSQIVIFILTPLPHHKHMHLPKT